jgi:hypothetical protein
MEKSLHELRFVGFPANLATLKSQPWLTISGQSDGRLWLIALVLSVGLELGLVVLLGLIHADSTALRNPPLQAPKLPAITNVLQILPAKVPGKTFPTVPAARDIATPKPRFAKTSPDQAAARPEKSALIGESDTQAASNQKPTLGAPEIPSQLGIEPRFPADFETTTSRYRDGPLKSESPQSPAHAESPDSPISAPPSPVPGEVEAAAPNLEKPLLGTHPVDVPTAQIPPIRPAKTAPAAAPPLAPSDPTFRGNQRKSAMVGSISRDGRNSLAVADSPLGRYQAEISRAVESEWQRNCVRHRDFITPGFLTVRFVVETTGTVRTVQFVGEMETGEVQKGFTLNSIRDAKIPAMPKSLKKDYVKEPLELIFNFYF